MFRHTEELKKGNGYIFTAYHKPFSLLDSDFIIPIHAGRACAHKNKDGNTDDAGIKFLTSMAGDDTGDNISARNNEYSECTVLYWMWKNLNLNDYKYIGLFQYRRQLILNDVFDKAKDDIEKKAYKCVHFKNIGSDFSNSIGLTDAAISTLLEEYDIVLPYESDLAQLGITSPYDDWANKIPGVHIDDLVELEETLKRIHPELTDEIEEYLNSPRKRMYQIFIAKPQVIADYCKWMFNVLFDTDARIDTSMYSVNGKRTLGYLAEILYGFYFGHMQKTGELKIKECGVSFIDA